MPYHKLCQDVHLPENTALYLSPVEIWLFRAAFILFYAALLMADCFYA